MITDITVKQPTATTRVVTGLADGRKIVAVGGPVEKPLDVRIK